MATTTHAPASWSAPAERSGDGAFEVRAGSAGSGGWVVRTVTKRCHAPLATALHDLAEGVAATTHLISHGFIQAAAKFGQVATGSPVARSPYPCPPTG